MSENETMLSSLFKKRYIDVLRLFISRPDAEFYVNEILKMVGTSPKVLCDSLKELQEMGILMSIKRANSLYYTLNTKSDLVAILKKVITPTSYSEAGVDISRAEEAYKSIKKLMRTTYTKNVLSDLGSFGSLYALNKVKQPVLVSSVDSVGTKLKLAFMSNKHDTVGIDIVNHCTNDILVQGATPLYFLDYLGMHTVNPKVIKEIVTGLTVACKDNNIALIGGETAELSDFYRKNEYDLVGCIVGVVEKDKIINGAAIKLGDVMIGLKSNGLHTNGYTLARKVLLQKNDPKIVKELMKPHKSYLHDIRKLKGITVKGMAHITGGGLIDNVSRILPSNCQARIELTWPVPKIFRMIQEKGGVATKEMFHAFNMGVGFVVVVSRRDVDVVLRRIPDALVIGTITAGKRSVILA